MTDQVLTIVLKGDGTGLTGALQKGSADIRKFGSDAEATNDSVAVLTSGLQSLRGTLELLGLGVLFEQLVKVADGWDDVRTRTREAAGDNANLSASLDQVYGVAQRAYLSLDQTSELVAHGAAGLRAYGENARDAFGNSLGLVEMFGKALRVSGASQQQIDSAVDQFSKTLAVGKFQGIGFSTMLKDNGVFAKLLADSMGVSVVQLEAMSKKGEINVTTMLRVLTQWRALDELLAKTPTKIDQARTALGNAFTKYIGDADQAWKLSDKVAGAILTIAANIKPVMDAVITLGEVVATVYAVKMLQWGKAWIASLIEQAIQTRAATAAAAEMGIVFESSMMTSIKSVGLLGVAFNVLGAAIVGWQIGKYLADNFKMVADAGNIMVFVVAQGWEYIKYGAQVAALAIVAFFKGAWNSIKEGLAGFLSFYAGAIEKVDFLGVNKDAIATLRDYAAALQPATSANAEFKASLKDLDAEHVKARDANEAMLRDMMSNTTAVFKAKDAVHQHSAEVKGNTGAVGSNTANTKANTSAVNAAAKATDWLTSFVRDQALTYQGPIAKAMRQYEDQLDAIAQREDILRKAGQLDAQHVQLISEARKAAADAEVRNIDRIDAANEAAQLADKKRASDPINNALQNAADQLQVLNASVSQQDHLRQILQDQADIIRMKNDLEEQAAKINDPAWLKQEEKKLDIYKQQLEQIREIQRVQQLAQSGLFGVVGDSLDKAFHNGAKSFSDIFKQNLKDIFGAHGTDADGNPVRTGQDLSNIATFIGGAATDLAYVADQFKQYKDAPLNAIVNIASKIQGPIGDIAKAISAVNALFGGKLLGTNYQPDSSGRSVIFGASGFGGNTSTTEVKQKAFFGGRQWKTTNTPLDAATETQLDAIFKAMGLSMQSAARELGAQVPDLISGAFKESYDKNGKLLSSVSTVLGKTYNETIDQFTQRLQAENLIAVLAQVMPNAELQKIADGWRADAADLLDGANLLLAIQDDIKNGTQLWTATGDGVLTNLVKIVTDLQEPGEALIDTYKRLTATAQAYAQVAASAQGELLLANASDFAKSIIVIRQEEITRTKALQDQARALGQLTPREEDLADVRQAAQVKIDAAVKEQMATLQSLATDLYGTPLQAIQDQIDAITGAGNSAAGSLRNFLNSLLLSDQLSPLTDRQKLAEARTELANATQSKDVQAFIAAAQNFLSLSRSLNASGSDYNADFNSVQASAAQFGLLNNGSSSSLSDLIAQRDALQAQADQADRLSHARELAQGIADVSSVNGQTPATVAASLGVNLASLAKDLGLNNDQVGQYLQSLEVNTADLAQILIDLPDNIAKAMFDLLYASSVATLTDQGGAQLPPPIYPTGGGSSGGNANAGPSSPPPSVPGIPAPAPTKPMSLSALQASLDALVANTNALLQQNSLLALQNELYATSA